MKPVAQLIDSPENGDCFRACVASILEVDPLTLPNISAPEFKDRYWLGVMNEAIAKYNLVLSYTANGQCWWELPIFIWSVRSPRYEGKTHAVVVAYDPKREIEGVRLPTFDEWVIAWDPSPWRDHEPEQRLACYRDPLAAYFFVALDPRVSMRKAA